MGVQELASHGITAAIGAGFVQLLNWMNQRDRIRNYTMGAVDHAVEQGFASMSAQLERTDKRLEAMETQHEECEKSLAEVRAELFQRKMEIDRLMAGPVAGYPHSEGGEQ